MANKKRAHRRFVTFRNGNLIVVFFGLVFDYYGADGFLVVATNIWYISFAKYLSWANLSGFVVDSIYRFWSIDA